MVKPFDFVNKKGLHLCHLNIRSLSNKFDIVKHTISESKSSFVAFSETWLNENIPSNMIDIPGYSCTRLDRAWKENGNIKKGGGVCCYIKNDFCFSSLEYNSLNVSTKDIEVLWISLNIPFCRKIVIGIVYRLPQGNCKNCCDSLDTKIEQIYSNSPISTELFILGDFNINYFTKNSPEMRELKWLEQKNSLSQCINTATRYSNNNSCIDLILTNSIAILESGVLDVNLSDHEMIFVTRKHTKNINTPTEFTGRSYINFDEEFFQNQLVLLDWTVLYSCNDVNNAWKIMKTNIISTIDRICPTKTFKIKNLKDPWISQEILESIRDKDRLLARAKHTNNLDDWSIARNSRNEVKNIIKNAKSEFIKENLEEYQNDSKMFWKTMSNILPTKNGKNNKINLKDENGEIINSDKNAANFMNDFFTSSGPTLSKDLTEPWIYTGNIIDENIPDMNTNINEVTKLLKDINIHKSSAIPNLSSKVLKLACLALADQFTYLLNLCLSSNEFPDEWKQTYVTPIPKEGDLNQVYSVKKILFLMIYFVFFNFVLT